MNKSYDLKFKKKVVRLHLEEGRIIKDLAAEYGVSTATISNWVKQFGKEFQTNKEDDDYRKENRQLKKQLAELQKENDFLKKQWHSLQRRLVSDLSIYLHMLTAVTNDRTL